MAVKTLQVTNTGSAVQVSTTSVKVRWVTFQNNAGSVMRAGDANVSATQGISIASGGANFTPPLADSGQYSDLSEWWVIGTDTQVLDVVFDEVGS